MSKRIIVAWTWLWQNRPPSADERAALHALAAEAEISDLDELDSVLVTEKLLSDLEDDRAELTCVQAELCALRRVAAAARAVLEPHLVAPGQSVATERLRVLGDALRALDASPDEEPEPESDIEGALYELITTVALGTHWGVINEQRAAIVAAWGRR